MAAESVKGTLKVQGELQIEFSIGTEDNKEISRSVLEGPWNEKKIDAIDKFIADTYIEHTTPCDPSVEELQGPQALKVVIATILGFFGDVHVTIENQTAEDDRVVNMVTWQYTLKSTPPTAPEVVTVTGISMDRIAGGKIVESWNTFEPTYRLLPLLDLPCPTSGPVPGAVSCSPTKRCPRGYVCRSNVCRRV